MDITPERNSKIEKFFIAIFFSFAVATSAIANSAVLGLGLDSCAKVIENIEKENDLGAAFKAAYSSYLMGFLVVLMLSRRMIQD